MEFDQGMTRTTLKGCWNSIIRRIWLILLFTAGGFIVANISAWRNYTNNYQVTCSFVPSRYELSSQETPDSLESFNNYVVRSITYASMVKNTQMNNAVRKAVDFPLTAGDYSRAVSVKREENSAVVNVTLTWADEEELLNLQRVMKSYLSYLIGEQSDLGRIRWIDGYAEPVLMEKAGQYVKSLLAGVAGAVAGIFLGIFAAALFGLLDNRVFELEQVQYGHDMELLHIIPRDFHRFHFLSHLVRRRGTGTGGKADINAENEDITYSVSADYRRNCEMLAQRLISLYKKGDVKTIAWAPIGSNQEGDSVCMLTVQYMAEFDVSVKVIRLREDQMNMSAVGIMKRVEQEQQMDKNKADMVFIQFPDLAKYRGLGYFINQMDFVLFLFRYGKSTYKDLLYTAEQYEHHLKTGYIWTGVNKKYLRQPLRDFHAISEG